MNKIAAVTALGAGLLVGGTVVACGDWTSSPYPSGEVIELAQKDEWVEYDCTIDSDGDINAESCDAEYVEDCNMVRFVTDDGVEFADCTDKSAWKGLDIGDTYIDE